MKHEMLKFIARIIFEFQIWSFMLDDRGRYVTQLATRSVIMRRNVLRLYMSPDKIGSFRTPHAGSLMKAGLSVNID